MRFWHSEAGWPQALTFDYGESLKFNVIHISNVNINDGIHLKDFIIQASNNLLEWEILFTGMQKNSEVLQIFNFPNDKAFRFYRIDGYSNYHDSPHMILANIEFFYFENNNSTLIEETTDYDTQEEINTLADLDEEEVIMVQEFKRTKLEETVAFASKIKHISANIINRTLKKS